MNKKVINIINVNIKDGNIIKIECVYKHNKNNVEQIILNTNNPQNVSLKYKTINFSKDIDITKINIVINTIKQDELSIIIKENNNSYNTILLDNKDEEISPKNNEYIIFIKKYKLKILNDRITIEKKKVFDKILKEIKKVF